MSFKKGKQFLEDFYAENSYSKCRKNVETFLK